MGTIRPLSSKLGLGFHFQNRLGDLSRTEDGFSREWSVQERAKPIAQGKSKKVHRWIFWRLSYLPLASDEDLFKCPGTKISHYPSQGICLKIKIAQKSPTFGPSFIIPEFTSILVEGSVVVRLLERHLNLQQRRSQLGLLVIGWR